MKLLATGDWHLGAGTSLGRHPGDRLADQRAVTEQIAALATDREVGAVLLAGDLLEGPHVLPEQLAVIADFVDACPCPVVAISGNGMHDASMREVNGIAIFNRIPGMYVYSTPAVHDLGDVQVACLPWVSPARLVVSMNGDVGRDEVNETAARLLVNIATGLRDPGGKPSVLLLHGSISGASLPTGISTDDLREPVLPLDDLLDLGYSAVVASHIHVPQYDNGDGWIQAVNDPRGVCVVEDAAAIYTGSPMPLNFGETNVPHGVWILDIDAGETRAEFVPVESRPLVQLHLEPDPGDIEDGVLWLEMPRGVLEGAIVKAHITTTASELRRLDLAALRDRILYAGAHTVKIETETIREDRARVQGVTADLDPLDAFDAWTAANATDTALAATAREQMQADLEAVGT